MLIKIPIDDLVKNWPEEAHPHLREKFGSYYLAVVYSCDGSEKQCRIGKARSRCSRITSFQKKASLP